MNNMPVAQRPRPLVRAVLPAILLLILSGCANPATQFYLLTPVADVPPPPGVIEPRLYVSSIALAEYLSRSQMVIREQANEVKYLDRHRWAEPLDKNIRFVLTQNLSKELPGWSLSLPEGVAVTGSSISVNVNILRFEGLDEGEAVMEAQWSVMTMPEKKFILKSASYQRPFKRARHVTLAEAMSAMLEDLARDIAATVQEIEKQP